MTATTDQAPPTGAATLDAEHLRFILGIKLRNLRLAKRLSLKEVARRAELSISYLSEIEKGKKYPKPEKLLRLARVLDVPFDELVSLKVQEELGPLRDVISSDFLREFPFELFGLQPEDLVGIVAEAPEKAGALVRTFLEVGKTYDVQVEHFLLAALRSYQQMNANYFPELEQEAAVYRSKHGWTAGTPVPAWDLRRLLETSYGYTIDDETITDHPELGSFRSVFEEGPPARLFVNGRLLPVQKAFVLAREIGYQHLGLKERARTSSWLKIESYEQVLNNFKASYFAGSLLIDRESLEPVLSSLFALPKWDPTAFVACLRRWDATPEMFLYRLTEMASELFGLEEIYFLRFNNPRGTDLYALTKVFNLSRVPVPHGIGLNEHYCRRWPAIRLLRRLRELQGGCARRQQLTSNPLVVAQRCRFVDPEAEFFVFSLARPLSLDESACSSVSVGFLIDEAFKKRVRFWDDPDIPRLDVGLTCERCPLSAEECDDRVAPPEIRERSRAQRRKERALDRLLT